MILTNKVSKKEDCLAWDNPLFIFSEEGEAMPKFKHPISEGFLAMYESRIKAILKLAKITHEDLAKACNVSRSTISAFMAPMNRGKEKGLYVLAVMHAIDVIIMRKSHDIWTLYTNEDINHDQWKGLSSNLNKARTLWLDIERYYLEHGLAEEDE